MSSPLKFGRSSGKYHAKKIEAEGYRFDSKAEFERYVQLKIMKKAWKIRRLQVHPRFELQEKFRKNNQWHRAITYEADFMYEVVESGHQVVEDVKGVKTEVFRIKQKLFEKKYENLTLTIINVKK